MFKKILIVLLVVLIVIQFIHPAKNISTAAQPYNIAKLYPVPPDVEPVLKKACYDCHSNNTRYPWYSKIQPVDWWLTNHINGGKRGLNFDEFTNKPLRFQYNKMGDVIDLVKKNDMPLNSYTWIHKDAILSDHEKDLIIGWAQSIVDTMRAKYPPDSLLRKKGAPGPAPGSSK
jgi:hypothetical protein